jgi:hypothetical protein
MSDHLDSAAEHLYGSNEAEPASAAYPDAAAWRRTDADAAIDWYRLSDWLARLGPMLWLHRDGGDRAFPRARLLHQGVLLLDHPSLAAFSSCVELRAHSAIGTHGPREWLELIDAQGLCSARLYLLPDADYLAWDAMLGECAIVRSQAQVPERWRAHTAFLRCALRRLRVAWRAQVVRFPLLQLPCLRVLGVREPVELSALGRQIAAAITRDEKVCLDG